MGRILTLLAVLIFALLALAPPCYLLADALFINGRFSLGNYKVVLLNSRQWELLFHSLSVGGWTCLFAFLFGVPFGFLLARMELRFKALFRVLYLVPVMIPTYILGITWTEHLDLRGLSGTVFLFTACYWPVVALFAEKGFRSVGRDLEDAARIQSCPLKAFCTVTLRLAMPAILAGELFVFILTVGDYGIPDFLSFNAADSYQVYTLDIFNRWSVLDSTGEAVASSLPVVVMALLAIWVILFLEGKGGGITTSFRSTPERPSRYGAVPAYLFMTLLVGASTILPLITLAQWVKQAGGTREIITVLQETFDMAGKDTLNSILSAALAAVLMVVVGFFIAYRIERRGGAMGRLLAFVSLLPLAFPPVMLAVADIRIWNHPRNPLSDLVYESRGELIMVYFARFIPIAILSLRAALKQVDPRMEEPSYMAGRGELFTMVRILGPLVWGGILAAFLLCYILCMRELDSVFLISAGNDTLPQRIYSQVHTSRDVGIGAMSLILVFSLLVPPAVYRLLLKGRISVL